jgi:ABC-2 type transport system permease protein
VFIGLVQASLILLVGVWWFNVPVRGSLAALYAAVSVFIAASLALGLVISTFAKTQFQAMQLSVFIYLPSILLSGFMFPFAGMPRIAQWIAEVFPLTHMLRLVRGILLRGARLTELMPEIYALSVFFAVMMLLAILRFRKRLD